MESSSNSTDLLGAVARAQRSFFQGRSRESFEILLAAALKITGSRLGFIVEVNYAHSKGPSFQTLASGRLAEDPANLTPPAVEPHDLEIMAPICKAVFEAEGPLYSDDPDTPVLATTPTPDAFLGVPLTMNGVIVGILGLVDRNGYGEDEIRLIDDFRQICASMVVAATQQRLKEKAERQRRESEQHLDAIVQSMAEGLITMDGNGRIRSANAAAEQFFGWTETELINQNISRVLTTSAGSDTVDIKKFLGSGRTDSFERRREAVGRKRDGTRFPVELTFSPVGAISKQDVLFVGLIRDITNRKRQEEALYLLQEKLLVANEKLAHSADTDALTGIGNRRFFQENFPGELNRVARTGRNLCLFILDVDYFKNYNDHYGHQQGDECLKAVAREAAGALNRSGEFLARIGGEEFVGLLPGTMDRREEFETRIQAIINKIQSLGISHDMSSVSPFVTASAGAIILKPDQECNPEWVLEQADRALYRAKADGRNRVVFAAPPVAAGN